MSNVNNFVFADKLQSFKEKVLDPHIAKIEKASKIMHDPTINGRVRTVRIPHRQGMSLTRHGDYSTRRTMTKASSYAPSMKTS